jgi:hypothetical protein
MNTQNKVFNKLFSKDKLELSSEKFEFGIIEDGRSLIDKAFLFVEIQSEIIALENKVKKSLPIYLEAIKLTNNGINKLKDLGVDGGFIASLQKINTEANQGYKSAEQKISSLSKLI